MAKPNNSIGKIKLPGENVERPLVPYALGYSNTNSYQATLPELKQDRIITTEYSKNFTYTTNKLNAGDFLFGQIIPDDLYKPWLLEYIIDIMGPVTELSNVGCVYYSARVFISSEGGFPSQAADFFKFTTIGSKGAHPSTSYVSILNSVCAYSLIFNNYSQAISAGYGHLIGAKNLNAVTFSASDTFSFKITIIKETNCLFQFFDNLYYGLSSTPIYINHSDWISHNVQYQQYQSGLDSSSIQDASLTVRANNGDYASSPYYITGQTQTSSSTKALFKSSYIYIYNNTLYANNGINTSNIAVGDTIYGWESIYYNNGEGNAYELFFPEREGTIALKSDIKEIAIEDLTNLVG